MKAIRCAEYKRVRSLQSKCRELEGIRINEDTQFSEDFTTLKAKVIELMQTDIRKRAEELEETRAGLPEQIYEHRKKDIITRLKRMLPAGSVEISAMVNESGDVVTSVPEIAKALDFHWQKVFDAKTTDQALRVRWLQDLRGKLHVSKDRLSPTREVVK
jgi:hypothetical protein